MAILVVGGLTLAAVGGTALGAPRSVARFERLKEAGTVGPLQLWAGERYTVFIESEGGSLASAGLGQVTVVEEATGKAVGRATVDLGGPSPIRVPPFGPALFEVLEFEAPTTGNYSLEYRVVETDGDLAEALVVARPLLSVTAARAAFFVGGLVAGIGLAGVMYRQAPLPRRRRKARRRTRAPPRRAPNA